MEARQLHGAEAQPQLLGQGCGGREPPYLDEIDFTIVPDDATRILQLKAGQVDATEFIPYERIKELQGDTNLTADLFPSTEVNYIVINSRPKLNDGTPNPLADERVRQALNFAINKQAIIQIITHGLGSQMHSYMSSATPLYTDLGVIYPYDLAKAKALLAEAGFGQGFSLTASVQAGKADDAGALAAIQQMWAPLGVKLKIEQMDLATLDARYHKGDFQLRAQYWTNDIADPNEITSYFAYFPNNQCQYSGWQEPTVDKLFEQSQVEQDPAKRAAEYREIQERYVRAAPILFLYESPFAAAQLKQVQGYKQIPLGNYSFETAYIEK
jgi:peptide/nickel transport system substrate-binding protein